MASVVEVRKKGTVGGGIACGGERVRGSTATLAGERGAQGARRRECEGGRRVVCRARAGATAVASRVPWMRLCGIPAHVVLSRPWNYIRPYKPTIA